MSRERPGKGLERLVTLLERAIQADASNIEIESPKRVRDSVSGRWREHDVVLTSKQPLRTITIAIECRDLSRKVGVGDVEEFRQKCLDTGIDKGAIASATGFTGPTLVKAARYGIDCLSVEDAGKAPWLSMLSMASVRREVTHVGIEFIVDPPMSDADLASMQPVSAFWPNGEAILPEQLINVAVEQVSKLPMGTGSEGALRIVTPADGVCLVRSQATRVSCLQIIFHVRFRMIETEVPLLFRTYRNEASGQERQAALAEITVGRVPGTLAFVREGANSEVKLVWVPAVASDVKFTWTPADTRGEESHKALESPAAAKSEREG